jgi:uncharacterized protein YndB with AHSA1/START domain
MLANKSKGPQKIARMSDEAVKAKTGKIWAEWFKILDAAGAKKLDHKGIVAILSQQHGLRSWWQQMVTVGYEQERGLREVHQKAEGWSVSASKTVTAPVMTLYDAWLDQKTRDRWLPRAAFQIRKATPGKSVRITWTDKKTSVEVNFYPKANNKSQVAVQHDKLADAKALVQMKSYWSKALGQLKSVIEA